MKISFKASVLMIILVIFHTKIAAQIDPHFSQYYAHPLWLNPGLTGVIDGDYRVSLNVKEQWSSISNSYFSAAASVDVAPVKNLSYGAIVLAQKSGELNHTHLNALLSGAYRIRFGSIGQNMINFGLQAGIINKSFDPSKMTLGSQYDPNAGYNPSFGINESFSSSNTLVPDVNFGFLYVDGNPDQSLNVFMGGAAAHLTRPVDKFFGEEVRMPIRYSMHGGVRTRINDFFDITPNILYMRQGTAKETSIGAYAKLTLNNEIDLMFGGNHRLDDAAIAFFGLNIRNMIFGLSYDFNTSSLNRATASQGGLELSIAFTKRGRIIGPNFFCPRL